MGWNSKVLSAAAVLLLLGVAFQPAVNGEYDEGRTVDPPVSTLDQVPGPFRELDKLVAGLIAATPLANRTDTDGDDIPDGVERVIGTDPENPDSDFDLLGDMEEVSNNTDPMTPDSNGDGILDVHEVRDGVTDLDGDGMPNPWDRDNDGDGLADGQDLCPFSTTTTESSFHLDLTIGRNPTVVYFQVRTQDPDHMRLTRGAWDWPRDTRGRMRDLDNSEADLTVVPIMELRGGGMPDSSEVAEFGVITNSNRAYLSMMPMMEYGNVVALQGQMYYPAASSSRSLSLDAELVWRVSGTSDRYVYSYQVDGSGYLTINESGRAFANGEGSASNDSFELVDLGGGSVAFKASNGLHLSVATDGSVSATSQRVGEDETFQLEDDGKRWKADEWTYLRVAGDGSIQADAEEPEEASTFEGVKRGVQPTSTILASYKEPFTLVGFAVEESRGTDVALVHNKSKGSALRTLGANLYLAYEFLRNASNNASDISDLLADAGIHIDVDRSHYNRSDEAGSALFGHLIKDIKKGFPAGETLPLVMAMQSRTVYVDMSHIGGGAHILGRTLKADLTGRPTIDKRVMKTCWYNSSSDEAVPIERVIESMVDWDVDPEDLTAIMALVVAWSTGEARVVSYGDVELKVEDQKWAEVLGIAQNVYAIGMLGLEQLGKVLIFTKVATSYAYLMVNNVPSFLAGLLAQGVKWGGKVVWNSVRAWGDVSKQVGSLTKGVWGAVNAFNSVMKWAFLIGLALDITMLAISLIAVGFAYGWSSMGLYAMAVTFAVMAFWIGFNFLLTLLAFLPVVGWVFALIGILLTLGDYLGYLLPWYGKNFSQWIIDWIIDTTTEVVALTKVWIRLDDTEFYISDGDDNGIDVGDSVVYKTRLEEKVQRASRAETHTIEGTWEDVLNSYIHYDMWIKVPRGSDAQVSIVKKRSYGSPKTRYYEPDYKVDKFDITGTVTFTEPCINFPYTFGFNTTYRFYYEDRFGFIIKFSDKKRVDETVSTDPMTIYYDVMPGTLDDFLGWKAIKSLDHDGDGINDTDEDRTDPWKWDTDGDGLGDAYEPVVGTDPLSTDSDRDGLDDLVELEMGSDPNDQDSDGDGLFDHMECNGWVITFEYEGREFDWLIRSDPCLTDSDGDGLEDDMEYVTLQNPMSRDTDGDGVEDALRDYTVTTFEPKRAMPQASAHAEDVVVDEEGYMYATFNYLSTSYIAKYAPNGTLLETWTLDGTVDGPRGIALDGDGYLWFINSGSSTDRLVKLDRDGTVVDSWHESFWAPKFLAIDAEGYIYVTDAEGNGVGKFAPNKSRVLSWGGSGSADGEFSGIEGIAVSDEGLVYVVDHGNDRVQVFDTNGTFIRKWGTTGTLPGLFSSPWDVAIDANGDVIVSEDAFEVKPPRVQKFDPRGKYITSISGWSDLGSIKGIGLTNDTVVYADYWGNRLREIYHNVTVVPAEPVNEFEDTDGDGLSDVVEETGWSITFTNSTGEHTIDVTSDPRANDTDGDGLNDSVEHELGSNPRSVDTDGDGIADGDEGAQGGALARWGGDRGGRDARGGLATSITDWDTDGDGLDDAVELGFGSDPTVEDTDGEGLTDDVELLRGSHPNMTDSDGDGLDDAEEVAFASSPVDPDTDQDLMLDWREREVGALPNVTDSDGDGLLDGIEDVYETNATNDDTDGDGLSDGIETAIWTDPLSEDTDGDGLSDSVELERGSNPRIRDSDGDGVPDATDADVELTLDGTVYAVVDEGSDSAGMLERLASMADVAVVGAEELLSEHEDARYIVLIGNVTSVEGPAGQLIRTLLEDAPDVLERMNATQGGHIAVRYGRWAPTQTVVMLSRTYASDHYRVMGVLKSPSVSVSGRSISFDHLAPQSFHAMQCMDTIHLTDSTVCVVLDRASTCRVDLAMYTDEDVPCVLDRTSGLRPGELAMGKYLWIEANWSGEGGDLIDYARVCLYYTIGDLDTTGDGDADDPEDLNETTLTLYYHDADAGTWRRLDPELDWVNDWGVNETDDVVYGRPYAGYIWANVSRLSLLGVGGGPVIVVPTIARAGPDVSVEVGGTVTLDGTASEGHGGIVNYTWTVSGGPDDLVFYGPVHEAAFDEAGEYLVSLTVQDLLGTTDVHTFTVLVVHPPPETFWLEAGPVLDQIGRPVEGATVEVLLPDGTISNITDGEGIACLEINTTLVGPAITLRISKEGYEPVELGTVVTPERVLGDPLPAMTRLLGPVTADPGPPLSVVVGEEVHFNGSRSHGNGGVSSHEWTFDHEDEEVVLTGPTPTFVFDVEGVYNVNLTVTDPYDVHGSAQLVVTVGPAPIETFLLRVGPVISRTSLVIHEALVNISVEGLNLSGRTDEFGYTEFELPVNLIGQNVPIVIHIEREDFLPLEYTTTVDNDGELVQAPPKMDRPGTTEPSDDTGRGGIPSWMYGLVAVVVLIAIIALLAGGVLPFPLTRGKDEEDEEGDEAGMGPEPAPTEGTEVVVEIDEEGPGEDVEEEGERSRHDHDAA